MLFIVRTSFDLPDSLLAEAKRLANKRKVPLRELIEEGLRMVLAQQRKSAQPFRIKDCSYGSLGLVEGLSWGDWDRMLELTYGDRQG
jgi:hypothetical protein